MKLTEDRKQKILEMIENIPQEKWDKLEKDIKQAQTKQCDIPVVVVQREQFVCKRCGAWTFTYRDSNGNPPKCKHCNGQTN
jgi:rubrerythrin